MISNNVYLASPWFNPAQKQRMLEVLGILREWEDLPGQSNRKVYAPYEELVCPPDAGPEQRKKVYESNLEAIAASSMIVAITDEKDIGTIYELGYAAALRDYGNEYGFRDDGPVLVAVALTLGNRPFNLMLAEGMDAVCTSLDQFREFMNTGIVPKHSWSIE